MYYFDKIFIWLNVYCSDVLFLWFLAVWLPFCLLDPYLSVPVTRCWILICSLTPRCTSKGNVKMTDLRLRWCKNDFFSAPRFLSIDEWVCDRMWQRTASCCNLMQLLWNSNEFHSSMPADGFHEADQYERVAWITRQERVWNCIGFVNILNVKLWH